MKIAFVLFDGLTALDLVGVFDPLTRLKTMGLDTQVSWELCARHDPVVATGGLRLAPTQVGQPLSGFDLVVVPGGSGTRHLAQDPTFLEWLRTAHQAPLLVSVCTGSLLLGAAGFLQGKPATSHAGALAELEAYCGEVRTDRLVEAGQVITAGGVSAGIDLGLYLVEKLAGRQARETIQRQMEYQITPAATSLGGRKAQVSRVTNETQVEVSLDLDGRGAHRLDTGIGFLDHMLSHLTVHGLFDLQVTCRGDLHVDVHHSVEDTALALGDAFYQALGERKGLVRMGAAYAPMDESLAHAAVDLSGRPYAVVQVSWRDPSVGGIPTSLFNHFLESFATSARCNLHAQVLYGSDDHHKAEALFKALGRALDAAVQVDPRRQGAVPSTKGVLA